MSPILLNRLVLNLKQLPVPGHSYDNTSFISSVHYSNYDNVVLGNAGAHLASGTFGIRFGDGDERIDGDTEDMTESDGISHSEGYSNNDIASSNRPLRPMGENASGSFAGSSKTE